jgi:hypothetical protein
MTVLEYNNASAILDNGAYLVSFSILVEDGTPAVRTRHYYGDLMPESVPGGYVAVQHDAVRVLLETPALLEAAQMMGKDQAVAVLTPA